MACRFFEAVALDFFRTAFLPVLLSDFTPRFAAIVQNDQIRKQGKHSTGYLRNQHPCWFLALVNNVEIDRRGPCGR